MQPGTVAKGPKPDWSKVKKQKVDFVITGAVKGKGAKRTLDLQVLTKPGAPKLKKAIPFSTADLGPRALETALDALNKAMGLSGGAAASPPPEAKKEPEPEPEAKKEPEAEAAPPKREPEARKEPTPPPPAPAEEARETPEPSETAIRPKAPIVEIEAGLDVFSRSFSYNQVSTLNLRSYSASFILAPAFRAEFYPLALVTQGAAAGIGIDGEGAVSVGLKSRRSGTDTTWPTSIVMYDFSVRYRIRPISTSDAAIIPFVGYAARSFSVGVGSDGSTLDGLPGVAYTAIRPGLAAELPFSSSGFSVFAKFAVQIVLSSGPIIGSTYFTKGSNLGLDWQIGAGFRIIGPLQIRVAFDFARYGLGFTTAATDTYQAAGAVDLYLGGNVALRLIF